MGIKKPHHTFWRNAGCVHCHAGEGRAARQFNMSSDQQTMAYLQAPSHQFEVYKRLMIRHDEAELGLGFTTAGMPMTGAPLPRKFIRKLAQWMKSDCLNQNNTAQCAAKN